MLIQRTLESLQPGHRDTGVTLGTALAHNLSSFPVYLTLHSSLFSRLPIFLNPISYPPPVIPSSFHLSFIFCEEGFTMLYIIGVGHNGLGNICNFQYSLQSILGYFIRSSLAAPSSSKLHTPTPKQSHILSLSLFA